jgi:molecular chaperone DnaK (HSP70)
MAGRLAVDFGTSNTVLAVWNPEKKEGVPLHLAELGRELTYRRADQALETISIIPSVIHYATGDRKWVGNQVFQHHLYDSGRTFRWMKRYISRRSPNKIRVADREISPGDAACDFLSAVLALAAAEIHLREEEVAFTVPVESFEHYENWLRQAAEASGVQRFRVIDEPSAAALGYGVPIQPGDVYLIFDFGGGTLDVALVLIEAIADETAGRRCRVLGKAGSDIGGATIDGWLFAEILRQNGGIDADEAIRPLSRLLLSECERAKELLSLHEEAAVQVSHPQTGAVIKGTLTRGKLEEIFDANSALTQIDRTIRRALTAARERGYDEDNVKSVLLVGGSSLIPAVQRTVQRIFGRERVRLQRPLDAVARGAAAFVAGVDFYDHILHDYAIRSVIPQKGDYEYRRIVSRGTPYPTREPVASITVKASHDGQTQLGLAIFELGDKGARTDRLGVELVFDPQGSARLRNLSPEEEERSYYFWINEHNPTFLTADPPARKGEPRFEVAFGIDANKRLLITVQDLITKDLVFRNHPVVQLI